MSKKNIANFGNTNIARMRKAFAVLLKKNCDNGTKI